MTSEVRQKLDTFFSQYRSHLVKKGEIIIRAQEEPLGIFYLNSGVIKEYLISKKGEELVVNVFKPYSFFPMSYALNNTRNNYYFEAVSDCEFRRAPREDVLTFVKENSDILFDLLARVYSGTDGMMVRMAYLMGGSAYERLVSELVIQSERFGEKDSVGRIVLSISEKDLAALTGMTRETVSRELKILKDKNLVSFNRNFLVVESIDKLKEEVINGV
ncbi:MAG: Crp/Fnr family transcriptional regulator [Candidatus Levybacteria bacterium]|nr:Crp/Fnr family transcriptional regulator [Candidatus Levybacteria bacterium]MBP9815093.1 Crp/Fnr family transcriptional regulator [Candidatus Levybacteria bacterium]